MKDPLSAFGFVNQWALGNYDNGEDGCPNCGRHRLCLCPNGKHRCEKCNWSPEEGDYVQDDEPPGFDEWRAAELAKEKGDGRG